MVEDHEIRLGHVVKYETQLCGRKLRHIGLKLSGERPEMDKKIFLSDWESTA